MEVLYPRCAGCDVHKKTVVVTVLITDPTGTVQKQTRTFRTMTADLLALDEWLRSLEVVHVVIASTGVFCCCPSLEASVKEEVKGRA